MNERIEMVNGSPHFVTTREISKGRTCDVYHRVPPDLAKDFGPPPTVQVRTATPASPPTPTTASNTGGETVEFAPVVPYFIPPEKKEEFLAAQRKAETYAAANAVQPRKKIVNAEEGTYHMEGESQEFMLIKPPEYYAAESRARRELFSS